MRISAAQLKDAFLSILHRMVNTTVNVDLGDGNKRMHVQRSFHGVSDADTAKRAGALMDTDPMTIQSGDVYITDTEIVHLLNCAWDKLHREKTIAITDALLNRNASPSSLEGMCYEHDQLYRSTQNIQVISWGNFGFKCDTSVKGSQVFVMPDENTEWGPPCIVSCALQVYHNAMWGSNFPDEVKICRPVSAQEVTSLANLATNSRYSSGALFRHRKMRWEKATLDVIEVFHRVAYDPGSKIWAFAWGKGGVYITCNYIHYPKPLTLNEINDKGYDLDKEYPRMIEVAYGYDIAEEAARIATMNLHPTREHQIAPNRGEPQPQG